MDERKKISSKSGKVNTALLYKMDKVNLYNGLHKKDHYLNPVILALNIVHLTVS